MTMFKLSQVFTMSRLHGPSLAAVLFAGAVCAAVPAAACEKFAEDLTFISNSRNVGWLSAKTENCKARVGFHYSDNGRGPKHAEEITFGPGGIPTRYSVVGASLFGGPVDELYSLQGSQGIWRSQPDKGVMNDAAQRLYLVNDSSPYSLAVYARALLAAPGHKLPTAPDGELRLTKVGDQALKNPGGEVKIAFYRIDGSGVTPDYVALDSAGRMFAATGTALAIRKGWEDQASLVEQRFTQLKDVRERELQKALAHPIDRPVRIRNVRIFDAVTGLVGVPMDVVVSGDRITAIGATGNAPLVGESVMEGQGRVLIPGLHDMHAHDSIDSGLRYLAAGVTGTRDMGNNNARLEKITTGIRAGDLPGPDIVRNGYIEGKSAYSSSSGILASSLEEGLLAVRWYGERGYFQIKLYNSINPDWVKPMAALAHSMGMGVTGHIPAFTTPDAMIDAGYNEIAHVNQLLLGWVLAPGEDTRTTLRLTALPRAADLDLDSAPVQATIAHMQREHIAVDTTAVILEQLMMSRAGEDPPSFSAVMDHYPVGLRRERSLTYMPLSSPEEDQRYRKAFSKFIELVGVLHAKGIILLPGTDNGDGFALHRELELYTKAGISPAETLSIATLGMARYLKQDKDTGTIEVGKVANMVLLEGDPTKDISAVRKPVAVFKRGYFYAPDEIDRALNIKPFAVSAKIERR